MHIQQICFVTSTPKISLFARIHFASEFNTVSVKAVYFSEKLVDEAPAPEKPVP